ncbi:MAG TPA: hypothetical protein VNZ57_14900 [Longimicrobiales bacterium]|nr:hypothetical protein [Longimicrobiales bacterium]
MIAVTLTIASSVATPVDLRGAQLRPAALDTDSVPPTEVVAPAEVVIPDDAGLRATGLLKWGTLAASLGTATYGITRQRAADKLYASIELDCAESPARCGERYNEGEFEDPILANRYQSAQDIDRRARVALIVSQVAVLGSVALFLLDLDDRPKPVVDPYDPPLRLELGASGLGVSVRVATPTFGTSEK